MLTTTRSTDPPRVLVIEDEAELREAVVSFLRFDGIEAHGAGGLEEAERWLLTHTVDVLVLDLGLPDGDGLAWLERGRYRLRDKGIVIMSARGEPDDRVQGALNGADSYLVKPVPLEELSAVVRNLLRRLRPTLQQGWVLDTLGWSLSAPDGRSVRLTHSEQVLLTQLSRVPGRVVSRQELTQALGHDPEHYDLRRLEIMVRRLRSKVMEELGHHLPLLTAHRQGYAFTAPISVIRGN